MLAEALRLATWLGFERKVVLHYIKNFRLATGVGHFFATYIAVCILRSILPSILPSILLSIYCRPYIERPYIKRPYIAVQYIAVHILNVHILNVHIAVYIAVCYSNKVSYCTVPTMPGFNMLPHLIRPVEQVNATFDKVFHYVDGNYKLQVHHFLMTNIVENKLFRWKK